jgi:hypothetical protein
MKERVQKFGRFLSGMVMPNIGAFIAWGFIAALFIADGWFPNEAIATMVTPMLNYLLPLLIGYTGGKMVGGQRGAWPVPSPPWASSWAPTSPVHRRHDRRSSGRTADQVVRQGYGEPHPRRL